MKARIENKFGVLRCLEPRTFIEQDSLQRKVVKSKESSTKCVVGDGLRNLHVSLDTSQIKLTIGP